MQKQIGLLQSKLEAVTKDKQLPTPPNPTKEDKRLEDAMAQIKRLEALLEEKNQASNHGSVDAGKKPTKPTSDDKAQASGHELDDADDDQQSDEDEFLMTPSGHKVPLLS